MSTASKLHRILIEDGCGRDKALKADRLAELLGLPLTRENVKVRKLVRELRLRGVPVCSHTGPGGGFYLAQTREDLRECIRSLRRRLAKQAEPVEEMEVALARWDEGGPDAGGSQDRPRVA